MKQLLILFFALFVFTAFNASAQCPTPGLAVVEVCNDTGGNGTIRVYTTDGGVPTSFLLFSISLNQFVSVPIGSVPVNTSIPLPPGAIAGVEFTLVPDDDYVVRINCLGGGFVVVGGGGINVNSANALILSKTPDFNLVCPTDTNGAGMFTASSGSPPYTFTLDANTTGGSTSSTPTTFSFNGAGFGLVTVTVTDNRNCTVQETINVIAPPYSFSTGKSDVSCFGGNDGSITVTVSGGTAPYEFSSNNGVSFSPPSASPFTFNTLTAGGYSIVVRDANLCLTSPTLVTINEPPIISITGSSSTNVSCNGGSDGSVTVTGAGGTGTLTYTLNPGAVMNTTGNILWPCRQYLYRFDNRC
ncbi:MAG: hypothetical protein HC811_06025 [Flammeovirgaceae bacterium]|nr:hypothetical protein [Flammeovirgaceae bacterium]